MEAKQFLWLVTYWYIGLLITFAIAILTVLKIYRQRGLELDFSLFCRAVGLAFPTSARQRKFFFIGPFVWPFLLPTLWRGVLRVWQD